MNDPIRTRRAPKGMRLPVPRHVQIASAVMGLGTATLGLSYVYVPVYRPPGVAERSVVAAIEVPLGWTMTVIGLWLIVSTALRVSRASAHTVAAVAWLVYLGAVVITIFLTYPLTPPQAAALAVFGVVAHGGAAVDYWKRGYR